MWGKSDEMFYGWFAVSTAEDPNHIFIRLSYKVIDICKAHKQEYGTRRWKNTMRNFD